MECVSVEEWKNLLEKKLEEFNKELEILRQDPVKNKEKIYLREQTMKHYSHYINQK